MKEWDYKVLVVNQQGKVEYIDGMYQGEEDDWSFFVGFIASILSFVPVSFRRQVYPSLDEILPKLLEEGWEVDDIEPESKKWRRNWVRTTYTLKRLIEVDEWSDES